MKTNIPHRLLTGLALLGALPVGAQTTLTFDNFSYRNTAPTNFFGTPSTGEIVIDPDAGFTIPGGGARILEVPLRWQDLDLDGVGGNDDYINFTLRFTGNEGTIAVSNQGVGLKSGPNSINNNVNPGEEMLVEIVNPVLSPGTAGAATIDGFSEGGIGGGGNGPDPDPTNGFTSFELNSSPGSFTILDPTSALQYTVGTVSLGGLAPSLYYNNIVATPLGDPIPDGGGENATILLSNRVRQFDFQISHDPSGTPVTPPVCFTTDNLRLARTNTNGPLSIVNPNVSSGGSVVGSVILNPDVAFDIDTAVPNGGSVFFDVPLRMTGLDLDGVGGNDDYFNFTFRVNSLTGAGARFSAGNGIGFNGGSWAIDEGEGVFIEIVGIELKPGISGAVDFGGFLEAAMVATGSAGAELQSTGDGSLDINGVTATALVDGLGFQAPEASRAFFPSAVANVLYDNAQINTVTASPTISPLVYARNYDLQFCYLPEVTPAINPEKCFSVSDLSLRNGDLGAGGSYVFNGTATTSGTIAEQPGTDSTVLLPNNEASKTFPVRWTVDLNGDSTDDYVDVDVVVTAAGGDGLVNIGGEGVGVVGGTNAAMEAGESLSYEITNIVVDPAVGGTVTFSGFNGGQYLASGDDPADTDTNGSATATVGGNPVSLTLTDPGMTGGYVNTSAGAGVFPRVNSLVFDNVELTAGSVTPNVRVRGLSFQMCWSSVSTAPSAGPTTTAASYLSPTQFSVTFTTEVGQTYKVTGSDDLSDGFPDNLSSGIAGTGAEVTEVVTHSGGSSYFLRVEEE